MVVAQQIKKVGGKKMEPLKVKNEKPVFDVSTAVKGNKSCVDENGLLTSMPDNYVYGDFKGLKKEQFANKTVNIEYRAGIFQWRGERMIKKAGSMRADAGRLAKFGDEKTAKKAKKVSRIREEYAKLMAELKADGVEIDDIPLA